MKIKTKHLNYNNNKIHESRNLKLVEFKNVLKFYLLYFIKVKREYKT